MELLAPFVDNRKNSAAACLILFGGNDYTDICISELRQTNVSQMSQPSLWSHSELYLGPYGASALWEI